MEGVSMMSNSKETRSAGSAATTKRSPKFWLAVVGGLLVLAIVAAVAYYALSGFFNANGTWYGPMHVKTGAGTVTIETYMDDSTFFTGSISGKGTFCVPLPFNNTATFDYSLSGNHDFVLPGRDDPQPITLKAENAVSLPLGIQIPIGPSLTMHGNATSSAFHLTGGDSGTSTTLDMKHGSKDDFMNACKSLSPLG
jgi:hypothetical protein